MMGGGVSVEDLAQQLDVSLVTIYRDIGVLEEAGAVRLDRGMVTAASVSMTDLSSAMRADQATSAKEAFAEPIAEIIAPSSSIIADDSSSVLPGLSTVTENLPTTVITNSLAVLRLVGSRPHVTLHVVGGEYYPWSESFYGANTVAAIKGFEADYCLMSDSAISSGYLCNPHTYVAETKRAMLDVSKTNILLADLSKFDKRAPIRTAAVSLFDYIVTEKGAPDSIKTAALEAGVEVIEV